MNSQLQSNRPERTESSWASVIKDYEAVPETFKRACQPLLSDTQPFPYIVFAPVIPGFRHKTTEQLIGEVADTITIWEQVGSQIRTAVYPLKTISMVEIGHILLYSWITISGVTHEGVRASSTVSFNTMSTPYFEPFVNRVRPVINDIDEIGEWQAEKAKFSYLEADSYKFMNYARKSLLPGEKVIQTIWQPKIRKPIITLFGWSFYRTRTPTHLVILTDKEVIFICEDPRLVETKGGQYGGIWQYIPLHHITSVSISEQAGDLLPLSLNLAPGDQHLDKLFVAANQHKIQQFRDTLTYLIGDA